MSAYCDHKMYKTHITIGPDTFGKSSSGGVGRDKKTPRPIVKGRPAEPHTEPIPQKSQARHRRSQSHSIPQPRLKQGTIRLPTKPLKSPTPKRVGGIRQKPARAGYRSGPAKPPPAPPQKRQASQSPPQPAPALHPGR